MTARAISPGLGEAPGQQVISDNRGGAVAIAGTPEQCGAFIKEDFAKWSKVVKEANIKVG